MSFCPSVRRSHGTTWLPLDIIIIQYRGADKSLVRPGRKQATATEDFEFHTRVATLIVATIYLQFIQNRYMFRSFTVLQCRHQHCVQPVASDVEDIGYF